MKSVELFKLLPREGEYLPREKEDLEKYKAFISRLQTKDVDEEHTELIKKWRLNINSPRSKISQDNYLIEEKLKLLELLLLDRVVYEEKIRLLNKFYNFSALSSQGTLTQIKELKVNTISNSHVQKRKTRTLTKRISSREKSYSPKLLKTISEAPELGMEL